MKLFLALVLATLVLCDDPLITKEYTDYLKKHVDWEVADYESNIFRGWSSEEARDLLGAIPDDPAAQEYPEVAHIPTPAAISWAHSACDHGPQNQGGCGSCWAFATASMLSSRCCMESSDHGLLSAQELVGCVKSNYGCNGGSISTAVNYIMSAGGLVPDRCFPYKGRDLGCPERCVDGSGWAGAHVCRCSNTVGCSGTMGIKSCLATGPVPITIYVCRSLYYYKRGIYMCDCTSYDGVHALLVMGYAEDKDKGCYYHVRNSWGTAWGDGGYFKMGCVTCRIVGGYVCGSVSE